TGGYGNYNTESGSLYVTGPIADTLAANLAVQGSDQRDGWGKSLITGQDNGLSRFLSGRGKLLWTPTDNTRVTLSGDYYSSREVNLFHPVGVTSLGYYFPGFYNTLTEMSATHVNVVNYGASLKIQQSFSYLDFVSITARRETSSHNLIDYDALPVDAV